MPGQEPLAQAGPPRSPLPGEDLIDETILRPGDEYSGDYAGKEFTCDNSLNVREPDGPFAKDARELAIKILSIKGQAGKFRITPKKNLVLVRIPRGQDWMTVFVTRLASPLEMVTRDATPEVSPEDVDAWLAQASPGDSYPFPADELSKETWKYSQKRGGLITKKISQGEAFARVGEKAVDTDMGEDATQLLAAITTLRNTGEKISRLDLTKAGHVLYRNGGTLHFIYALKKGLEFPD